MGYSLPVSDDVKPSTPETATSGTNRLVSGYRYYSTEMGRWVSRDPIGEYGGVNLFCFLNGMPIHDVDFLGMESIGGYASDGSGCCCPDYLNGGLNVRLLNSNGAFGHSFDVYVRLVLKPGRTCQPCSLKWEEKTNDPYVDGMSPNAWNDMTDIIPRSPTFAAFEGIRLTSGSPANSATLNDTPKRGILNIPPSSMLVNNRYTRVLEFNVTVSAGAGCRCSNQSLNYKAKQTLVMYKTRLSSGASSGNMMVPIVDQSSFVNL